VRKADNLNTILCRCHENLNGNPNFLEHFGPVQTCNETALPLPLPLPLLNMYLIIFIYSPSDKYLIFVWSVKSRALKHVKLSFLLLCHFAQRPSKIS